MIAIITGVVVVACSVAGCQTDDDVLEKLRGRHVAEDTTQSLRVSGYGDFGPYHRTFVSPPCMQYIQSSSAVSAQPYLEQPMFPYAALKQQQSEEHSIRGLKQSITRINDRHDDLKRILHELELEKQNFEQGLSQARQEYDRSRQIIESEYGTYMARIKSLAAMQSSYSQEMVYVNAFSPVPHMNSSPFVQHGYVQPFGLPGSHQASTYSPQTVVVQVGNGVQAFSPVGALNTETRRGAPPQLQSVTQAKGKPTLIADQQSVVGALTNFIDTCNQVASFSHAGSGVSHELMGLRSDILSHETHHSISSDYLGKVTSSINALVPQINSLPRKTMVEVWIDPEHVASAEDRRKLDRLVVEEARSSVTLPSSPGSDEMTSCEIPNIFSLSVHKSSRNHRLRIFKDTRNRQIKLVATCGYRNFKRSEGERYFLSFTCDDTSRSFSELASHTRRSILAKSVLKVVCHSKELARKLIFDDTGRVSRCSLSKWSELANGVPRPHFASFDSKGKGIWNMLHYGEGCFTKYESAINSSCSDGGRGFLGLRKIRERSHSRNGL